MLWPGAERCCNKTDQRVLDCRYSRSDFWLRPHVATGDALRCDAGRLKRRRPGRVTRSPARPGADQLPPP
jgi:hypothetical protein